MVHDSTLSVVAIVGLGEQRRIHSLDVMCELAVGRETEGGIEDRTDCVFIIIIIIMVSWPRRMKLRIRVYVSGRDCVDLRCHFVVGGGAKDRRVGT